MFGFLFPSTILPVPKTRLEQTRPAACVGEGEVHQYINIQGGRNSATRGAYVPENLKTRKRARSVQVQEYVNTDTVT